MKAEIIEVLVRMAELCRPAYPEDENGAAFRAPSGYAMALVAAVLAMDGAQNPWIFPEMLRRRLGLDVLTASGIAKAGRKVLVAAAEGLHRSPRTIARWLYGVAMAVMAHFGGDAAWIWNDGTGVPANLLLARLLQLPGIGSTKALVLMSVLGRDWGIKITEWEKVDPETTGTMRRATGRLGLIGGLAPVDPHFKAAAYEGLRALANTYCLERPACGACPMEPYCPKNGVSGWMGIR